MPTTCFCQVEVQARRLRVASRGVASRGAKVQAKSQNYEAKDKKSKSRRAKKLKREFSDST